MGTSKLPDQIPIPSAIKLQDKVYGFGALSGLAAAGAFVAGQGLFGFAAGAASVGLFWAGSKIRTHKTAVGEGKVYR